MCFTFFFFFEGDLFFDVDCDCEFFCNYDCFVAGWVAVTEKERGRGREREKIINKWKEHENKTCNGECVVKCYIKVVKVSFSM